MTSEEYNRALSIERSVLWRTIYALHYNPEKKRSGTIAAVHADSALRQFNQHFKADLNVTRPPYPPTLEVQGQA